MQIPLVYIIKDRQAQDVSRMYLKSVILPLTSSSIVASKCTHKSHNGSPDLPCHPSRSCPNMYFYLIFPFLSLLSQNVQALSGPIVTVKNGSIEGLHSTEWNQDFFLGIPYAQPPLGDLRFKWPQSIKTTWNSTLDATNYGYSCYQYATTFNLSEDCLTLNGTYDHHMGHLPLLLTRAASRKAIWLRE